MDKIDRLIKFIREEGGMTTGSTAGKPGFSNAADAEGPVAGRDELMFAKPQKRKKLFKKIIGLGRGSRKRWMD
tara:strand:+ start:360 stop:578 length:219 start_codon:yes stop_codon:yes gene_type:complete